MNDTRKSSDRWDQPVDAAGFASAILNILEDAASERLRLADTQKAVSNVLDDAAREKQQIEATQRAVLNLLEDTADERLLLDGTQRAVLNILEDAAAEKQRVEISQKAILNVLEDDAGEKSRFIDTQRAVLNILEDFDTKNSEVERINREMAAEIVVRKQAEEALTVSNNENKELEAFSYSVAHDLRAPLRSIDGFSQALEEEHGEKLDAEGRNYLARIRAAAQRMALLIDELLKLARISRGELHFEPLDLSVMARSILAALQEAEPQRLVQFVIPDTIPVDADPPSLRAALENLLGNAWKFTGKNDQATIEVGVCTGQGQPTYFVRDNGVGFDMKYAGKLFGVFQRLHSDAEFPGVGIGLAIVQRVVLRHGGRVWAESGVGKGATFFFSLHEF